MVSGLLKIAAPQEATARKRRKSHGPLYFRFMFAAAKTVMYDCPNSQSTEMTMNLPKMMSIVPLAIMLAAGVFAQAPSVSQHVKPGDTLSYYVKFDDDPKFIRVDLQFFLQGAAKSDQQNMPTEFTVRSHFDKPKEPGTFDVQGKVSECATGTYELRTIQAYYVDGNTEHSYPYPASGQAPVTVYVENDKNLFPRVKSVSPNPSH
jgi:hypothetical protein